jgi:hypothetical protein
MPSCREYRRVLEGGHKVIYKSYISHIEGSHRALTLSDGNIAETCRLTPGVDISTLGLLYRFYDAYR